MRTTLLPLLLAAACAAPRAEDRTTVPLRACLEWKRPAPDAEAAAPGLFASFTRIASGPYSDCDATAKIDKFSDGQWWTTMKVSVVSSCGKPLGRFSVRYRSEWEPKLVENLYGFLKPRKDAVIAAGRECGAASR